MPRGDKSKYTEKQKRQAEHIKDSYEERGVSEAEAEKRAWASVNKISGGGKNPGGSGVGKQDNKQPTRKGGTRGGQATASRSPIDRSAAAKKAAATRRRNAANTENTEPS